MQLLFTCIHNADAQPKWHTCQPDYCWQKTLQQLWKWWNCNPKPWTWCPLQVWLPYTHIHNMNSAPFPGLSKRLLLCVNTWQVLTWTWSYIRLIGQSWRNAKPFWNPRNVFASLVSSIPQWWFYNSTAGLGYLCTNQRGVMVFSVKDSKRRIGIEQDVGISCYLRMGRGAR